MSYTTHPASGEGGPDRDSADHERLRHARDRHEGFPVGRFVQTPPMLFTRDGHNVPLGDMYRGHTAFLINAGPSLGTHDLTKLNQRGIVTCAVNNAAAVFRPHLWISVDDPGNFCDAIWYDPGIMKFVPLCHMEKNFMVRDESEQLVPSEQLVGDMPAVFGYRRNEAFQADQWLYEDTFNWGSHGDRTDEDGNRGSRSVLLIALRLLFYLGIRRVYLLGCDFRMQQGQPNYAFEQDRSAASVRGNNNTFRVLNVRLKRLLPHFEKEDFRVFNCTPESGLTVFPHVAFDEAVEEATALIPKRINTAGMYDRAHREKRTQKANGATAATVSGAIRLAQHNGNGQPKVSFDDYPEATLVIPLDGPGMSSLEHTWPTWVKHKPWLQTLPLLVIHTSDVDSHDDRLGFLRAHGNVRFVVGVAPPKQSLRESTSPALVKLPAQHIETPWYLLLAPEALATGSEPWVFPEWFDEKVRGRLPALIGSPWGYTKPADAIARLDDWGDSVDELAECPRLDLPYDPQSARIRHPTVSSWCLFGNTAWTRRIARFTPDELPVPSYATYVHYCAERLGEVVIRPRLKDLCWEHTFRWRHSLARRSQEVLTST